MTETTVQTKMNLPLCRVAFEYLKKPRAAMDKKSTDQSWGFTGIFTLKQLQDCGAVKLANDVLKAKFGPDAKFGDKYRSPFRKPESYDPTPEEFEGNIMLPMFSKNRPVKVADANLQPITSAEDIYAGMYAHASVTCYAYTEGSKGVNFGLNSVMKAKDGEPLAGAPSDPARDFANLDRSAYLNDGSVALGSGASVDDDI